MLGLNLLVRLGRLVSGPIIDTGVFPGSLYRHLALEAMEEDDYPGALSYLKWAGDPVLAQLLVLRLRLLAGRHRRQRRALEELLTPGLAPERRESCRELLDQENRALKLLQEYEERALKILRARSGVFCKAPPAPRPTTSARNAYT
jgi:hypothetical protein